MNGTLLCLIPKCENAKQIKYFKTIRLCNITHKVVTKIIVNRIKPILSSIIGPSQDSFLSNKRTSDSSIIVRELISHFRKMKVIKGSMILKIDLEKVFEKLEWAFIRDTLNYFGFPPNLVKLIMSCVTTTSISILINRKKTTPSKPTTGIRNGDRISPYTFIMCMDRLSKTIDNFV